MTMPQASNLVVVVVAHYAESSEAPATSYQAHIQVVEMCLVLSAEAVVVGHHRGARSRLRGCLSST